MQWEGTGVCERNHKISLPITKESEEKKHIMSYISIPYTSVVTILTYMLYAYLATVF